jgi:3-hydroxypropanoate dehydrogenase
LLTELDVEEGGTMKSTLPDEALNQIFHEARTHSVWLDIPVNDAILHQLYDLMKWGPTSANGSPARFVFCARRKQKSVYGPRWRRETWRRR